MSHTLCSIWVDGESLLLEIDREKERETRKRIMHGYLFKYYKPSELHNISGEFFAYTIIM